MVIDRRRPSYYKRMNERFPTVDYDDKQDLPDRENNAKRKAKQKRCKDGDLVPLDLGPGVDESASSLETPFTFP